MLTVTTPPTLLTPIPPLLVLADAFATTIFAQVFLSVVFTDTASPTISTQSPGSTVLTITLAARSALLTLAAGFLVLTDGGWLALLASGAGHSMFAELCPPTLRLFTFSTGDLMLAQCSTLLADRGAALTTLVALATVIANCTPPTLLALLASLAMVTHPVPPLVKPRSGGSGKTAGLCGGLGTLFPPLALTLSSSLRLFAFCCGFPLLPLAGWRSLL
mmetsp:Transcript_6936/g.13638  ORF Transcript_6936/g.13638 Transcript_6936/m.13638 type:complete len:218 (-) Transcript_6936:117-770(-)